MSDEIRVVVNQYGPDRNLMLRWTDPVSGKRKTKSAGTTNPRVAERLAGELERELQAGRFATPSRITWQEFRARYEAEKLATLAEGTLEVATTAMNHLERVLQPDRLARITSAAMSRFQAELRKGGMRETTIAKNLRHLKAAFSWGVSTGLMATAPKIVMPRRARGQRLMKGRPITLEEYERMVMATPKVRPDDTDAWTRLLAGLWLSGLRLGEILTLSWNAGEVVSVDLDGKRPVLVFRAEGQKSGKAEIVPVMPDFGTFLLATPEAERTGRVFKVDAIPTGKAMTPHHVGLIVTRIGRRAGVLVGDGKAASAHDLRRAFGSRWSRRLMPAVLKRLMRHSNIATTMGYYVDLDADDLAEELWTEHGGDGGNIGNKSGNIADFREKKQRGDFAVSPLKQRGSESGQGRG